MVGVCTGVADLVDTAAISTERGEASMNGRIYDDMRDVKLHTVQTPLSTAGQQPSFNHSFTPSK